MAGMNALLLALVLLADGGRIDAGTGPTPPSPPPPLRKIPDALIAAVTHVPRERFLGLNRRPEKRTPPPKRLRRS